MALCDLADENPRTYSAVNFNWLVGDHLPKENQLKSEILNKIFKIKDIPTGILPKLSFSGRTPVSGNRATIEFGPHWETGGKVVSRPFPRNELFKVVREFYREPRDSRRVHNKCITRQQKW